MKKYLKTLIMLCVMLAICTLTSIVNATYQSRPKTGNDSCAMSTTTIDFFKKIRKMENDGQTLGLVETIDETTGLSTNGSNGIDCHMMKNTEYGPVAILSSSIYGNAPHGYESSSGVSVYGSTTQNATGVFQMVNYYTLNSHVGTEKPEYLAAVNAKVSTFTQFINSIDKRYVDIYENPTNDSRDNNGAKVGDATKETAGWYGTTYDHFVTSNSPFFLRGFAGLFSFTNSSGGSAYTTSRAVVVCEDGI